MLRMDCDSRNIFCKHFAFIYTLECVYIHDGGIDAKKPGERYEMHQFNTMDSQGMEEWLAHESLLR